MVEVTTPPLDLSFLHVSPLPPKHTDAIPFTELSVAANFPTLYMVRPKVGFGWII